MILSGRVAPAPVFCAPVVTGRCALVTRRRASRVVTHAQAPEDSFSGLSRRDLLVGVAAGVVLSSPAGEFLRCCTDMVCDLLVKHLYLGRLP